MLNITDPHIAVSACFEPDDVAIGIDLGTTYSVMAYVDNGQPQIISIDGRSLIPSIVFYDQDDRLWVGQDGHSTQMSKEIISSFKKWMRNPSTLLLRDKTPVELSALVLAHLKKNAEQVLGKSVQKAVITVPAYFDDAARQATKDAAALAGLTVLRLVNEPTAAALSYGLDRNAQGIYAVYDLGGGTFDVSILKLVRDVFQVLATGGDVHLGGDDVDQSIVELWVQSHPTLEATRSLFLLAREAKEFLHANDAWNGESGPHNLTLTAVDLDILVSPLVQKTLALCNRVILDAGVSKSDIDGVVLVGGSTRLNAVRAGTEHFFGQAPKIDLDPDHVVALGAALQADALTSRGSNSLLLDVAPLSLGIETMGGVVEKIIPRNSPIPIKQAQEFTTHQDGQTAMKIHVVQGEREQVSDCRSLAEFILTGIPPMGAGMARILVVFTVDADGLLTVTAMEKTTGLKQEVFVKPSYGLTLEDFRKMLL
ncbi:MAG: Hsp70 family protein [Alphaproteobacteria bacterium]|nr:Hsp70 family protein [Alphaproteobacteria bacterium]